MNTPHKASDVANVEFLTESRQTMVMLTRHDLQLWVENLDRLNRSQRDKLVGGRFHPRIR
ncbi:MAG: hypothetical protein HQL66_11175 [Magnetococcales bacterium]|nr:hypothetical protein [Magnetococcales bacterium]